MSWDWLSSLWGGAQKKDLKNAYNQANQQIDTGYNNAMNYKNQAYGLYDPMAQSGKAAYDLYNNALGINGAPNAYAASQTIYNNPFFTDKNNLAQAQALAFANSRGNTGGNYDVAAQRALQDNVFNYLGLIKGVGDRGDNAINNQANIRLGQGDLAYGYGGTKAGMATNYGNARANAQGTLWNNIINGTAAFMGGSPRPTDYSSNNVYSQNGTQANGGWTTNAYANNQSSNNLMKWFS